jgi:hypothetical protein
VRIKALQNSFVRDCPPEHEKSQKIIQTLTVILWWRSQSQNDQFRAKEFARFGMTAAFHVVNGNPCGPLLLLVKIHSGESVVYKQLVDFHSFPVDGLLRLMILLPIRMVGNRLKSLLHIGVGRVLGIVGPTDVRT